MALFAIGLLATRVLADCYLHNPRGSNNRLAEEDANRNNGDRLFDSQNNNRGGYNVGVKGSNNFNTQSPTTPPSTTFDYNNLDERMQYQFVFFEESQITWEWTVQHGCGGTESSDPHKLNCQILLQYMCETDETIEDTFADGHMSITLRDGGNTATPSEAANYEALQGTVDSNLNNNRGLHESEAWYLMCERRQRNYKLFHADQNVNGEGCTGTRQNPNGNRRGLECPEERDYYPYWNPSPWRDIAVLTDDPENHCPRVMDGSQNHNDVFWCDNMLHLDEMTESNEYIPIDADKCREKGGTWAGPYNKNIDPPVCEQVGWSRVNHLGNGRFGQPVHYNWTLPSYQSLLDAGLRETEPGFIKCVGRIRYNMTTDDYDPYNTFSDQDESRSQGRASPVQQDPTIDVGTETVWGLKLAVNTNQFGRTFQDRSHVFYIHKRPSSGPLATKKIYNLNMRGKRCNIVQCFPGVEYDFMPNSMYVEPDALVHVQWTGSNTHNNGSPAGDGQAGDDGQGKTGTDRHNMVQLLAHDDNYPMPLDKFPGINMFKHLNCYDHDGNVIGGTDDASNPWLECALILATSGAVRKSADLNTVDMGEYMNDAPASLVGGVVLEPKNIPAEGLKWWYMDSRNNDFGSRTTKGTLVITGTDPDHMLPDYASLPAGS